MDLEVEIKAEPAWLEDEASTSLGNFEFVPETKPLKQETKLELPEPGPTQENTFELSAGIKGEISIEQLTVDDLDPHIKQEDNVGNVAALTVYTAQEALAGTVQSKAFLHKSKLKKKPYQCKMCNKAFTINGNLQKHMIIPSGEKPFHCKECNKSFSLKGHVRRHMVTHSGEKPFHCKECNGSFTQISSLRNHMLIHSGVRPFRCEVCNKSFSGKGRLRTHILIHSGVKPFHCEECNKSFSQKGHLRLHMFFHSGEKPFHCKECNKSFSQKVHLRTHMLIHSL